MLKQQHAQLTAEKDQIQTELQQRGQEIAQAQEEKRRLVSRLAAMERQLLTGGAKLEDHPQFAAAVHEAEQRLRREYENRFEELERERARLAQEKEQFEREKTLFTRRRSEASMVPSTPGLTPSTPSSSSMQSSLFTQPSNLSSMSTQVASETTSDSGTPRSITPLMANTAAQWHGLGSVVPVLSPQPQPAAPIAAPSMPLTQAAVASGSLPDASHSKLAHLTQLSPGPTAPGPGPAPAPGPAPSLGLAAPPTAINIAPDSPNQGSGARPPRSPPAPPSPTLQRLRLDAETPPSRGSSLGSVEDDPPPLLTRASVADVSLAANSVRPPSSPRSRPRPPAGPAVPISQASGSTLSAAARDAWIPDTATLAATVPASASAAPAATAPAAHPEPTEDDDARSVLEDYLQVCCGSRCLASYWWSGSIDSHVF